MKTKLILFALGLFQAAAMAADGGNLDQLKKDYQLTDAQVTSLKNSGLPDPQLAMVARLAKDSGKSIDDVLKMRTEQKMGWGEIAKKLGVPPKEIGQAVADTHRKDMKEERAQAREQRKDDHKADHENKGKGH